MMTEALETADDVTFGARRLVDSTVIRALIDQASEGKLALRDRIATTIDQYLEALNPQSKLEREFADHARRYAASLLQNNDP